MSLWTPSGEHPLDNRRSDVPAAQRAPGGAEPSDGGSGPASPDAGPARGAGDPPSGEEARDVDELRRQLADSPADVVVANHCYGLFELAAVYLSSAPARLDQARLAIDGLGAIVESLGERLGDAHAPLREALGQIRLAYVQIAAAAEHEADTPGTAGTPAPPGDGPPGAPPVDGS